MYPIDRLRFAAEKLLPKVASSIRGCADRTLHTHSNIWHILLNPHSIVDFKVFGLPKFSSRNRGSTNGLITFEFKRESSRDKLASNQRFQSSIGNPNHIACRSLTCKVFVTKPSCQLIHKSRSRSNAKVHAINSHQTKRPNLPWKFITSHVDF